MFAPDPCGPGDRTCSHCPIARRKGSPPNWRTQAIPPLRSSPTLLRRAHAAPSGLEFTSGGHCREGQGLGDHRGTPRPRRQESRGDAAQWQDRHRGREARRPVVLALPRGGVPVAQQVAVALGAPLDVIIVRKLGVPGQRELAMGAVADAGPTVTVRNEPIIRAAHVSEKQFDKVRASELAEALRRRDLYIGRRLRHPRSVRTWVRLGRADGGGSSFVTAHRSPIRWRVPQAAAAHGWTVAARTTLASSPRNSDARSCRLNNGGARKCWSYGTRAAPRVAIVCPPVCRQGIICSEGQE